MWGLNQFSRQQFVQQRWGDICMARPTCGAYPYGSRAPCQTPCESSFYRPFAGSIYKHATRHGNASVSRSFQLQYQSLYLSWSRSRIHIIKYHLQATKNQIASYITNTKKICIIFVLRKIMKFIGFLIIFCCCAVVVKAQQKLPEPLKLGKNDTIRTYLTDVDGELMP